MINWGSYALTSELLRFLYFFIFFINTCMYKNGQIFFSKTRIIDFLHIKISCYLLCCKIRNILTSSKESLIRQIHRRVTMLLLVRKQSNIVDDKSNEKRRTLSFSHLLPVFIYDVNMHRTFGHRSMTRAPCRGLH